MTSPSPRRLPGEPAELVGRSVQAEGGHVGNREGAGGAMGALVFDDTHFAVVLIRRC